VTGSVSAACSADLNLKLRLQPPKWDGFIIDVISFIEHQVKLLFTFLGY
jgi:hypothetical protein